LQTERASFRTKPEFSARLSGERQEGRAADFRARECEETGKVVANIPEIGGAEMVAYSAKNGQHYSGSSNFQPGAGIGVIDLKTKKLVQKIENQCW
jgi:hypothetical protein